MCFDTFCWQDPANLLPLLVPGSVDSEFIYPHSVGILCAYDNDAFQVCNLIYDTDDEELKWLEDTSDRWDMSHRVLAWSFIPTLPSHLTNIQS